MVTPSFFIVGAPKCGTTAWAQYLDQHPELAMARVKEPNFFNTDMPSPNNIQLDSLASYLSLFEHAVEGQIGFEATPLYMPSREAARNIHALAPDAKILVFLRNQITFLPSFHQQMTYRRIEEIQDFEQAWRQSGTRSFSGDIEEESKHILLNYKMMGRFDLQIQRYLEIFAPSNVKICRYEDWVADKDATALKICQFLNIEEWTPDNYEVVNQAKSHRSNLLAKLSVRPPAPIKRLAALVRSITGMKRLGVAAKIRELNQENSKKHISQNLADEISEFYGECNGKCAQMIDSHGL